jgi:hypothetical protein
LAAGRGNIGQMGKDGILEGWRWDGILSFGLCAGWEYRETGGILLKAGAVGFALGGEAGQFGGTGVGRDL